VSQSFNRVETFVTRGAPTTTVFKPAGKGIELVPVTHPNDLVAGGLEDRGGRRTAGDEGLHPVEGLRDL
ncbi:DUF4198 domain-containing protein, partial [Xanthomonas arboricola]|uniref:DUF4198 domain-containing protein n=1 Tax=Xanthomonas arboricola TaxID=56448 RepID=UPI00215843B1